MIKVFRAFLGVFSFRDREIAELKIAQDMDAEGRVPLTSPEIVNRRGLLWVEQPGERERDLGRNQTTQER